MAHTSHPTLPRQRRTGAVVELPRTGNNIRYPLNSAVLAAQGLQPTSRMLSDALRRIGGPAP
jgi:hypothetical protein